MDITIYNEIWHTFSSGDHISQASIWGGATLALVVAVDDPAILARITQTQALLAAELPFHPHLPETLHITLSLFGPPSDENQNNLAYFLAPTIASYPAFQVDLKRINSFFRAPFLEVHDDGALEHLMARIRPKLEQLGFPSFDYGPSGQVYHVTLGAYTEDNDGKAARRLLNSLRVQDHGKQIVRDLRLVMASACAPYRLDTLRCFPLAETGSR